MLTDIEFNLLFVRFEIINCGKMWKIPEQAILDYLNSLKVNYSQR